MGAANESLDALLPVLYLRGVSTGDFQEALARPPGQGRAEPVAVGDRPADGRMAGGLRRWQQRDLSARRYVYVWADGVYLQARMEEAPNACWC